MDSQDTTATKLAEMNQAVRLLWLHGYTLRDHGTSVTVDDPVSQSIGGRLVVSEYKPVLIRSAAEARRFIDQRS